MGRADLARHRKSSPSDTPPVAFPPSAAWVLPALSNHPHTVIAHAVRTIDNAPTQRAQVLAVKLLGHALRDAHSEGAQRHPPHLKCSCLRPNETVTPVCELVVPLLFAILFEAPAATAGLLGTALRAVLTARRLGITGTDHHFANFVIRLTACQQLAVDALLDPADADSDKFLRAAADVSALAVVVGESQACAFVFEDLECLLGALSLIAAICVLFTRAGKADWSALRRRDDPSHSSTLMEPSMISLDRAVLEGACDAAMKAAQDLVNYLVTIRPLELASDRVVSCVASSVLRFAELLKLPTTPRNCAMACSVAFVSGIIFVSEGVDTARDLASLLRSRILLCLDAYPLFSQLSLLRAMMEAPAAKKALHHLLFSTENDAVAQNEKQTNYIFNKLATLASSSGDVHFRFLAMDGVIACLHRATRGSIAAESRNIALQLIRERWHEPFPGVTAQVRDAMDVLISKDLGDAEASEFWSDMAMSIVEGDWHIKGIYAPLSVLVKRVGAFRILQVEPECQSLAMFAAAADSRLAKPVSDWLGTFWKVLFNECTARLDLFLNHASQPLLQCLVHKNNPALRERIAEHVLPVFFRGFDQAYVSAAATSLLKSLETLGGIEPAQMMRGTVCIMSVARKLGVSVGSFSDPHIFSMLEAALESDQEDIRSSTLDMIVTSRVSTKPISSEELSLLVSHLPVALMPGDSPSGRSRFRHSMRRLFERIAASRKAAQDGSSGWWMRERKQKHEGNRTDAFEGIRRAFLTKLDDFVHQLSTALLSSSYPGAAFSRRTAALESLLLLSENIGLSGSLSREGELLQSAIPAIAVCLLDEWERPRRAALQLMSSLARPIPGFDTAENVENLQKFSSSLLESPRLRDVDSGALLCRVIFRSFVQGTCDKLSSTSQAEAIATKESIRFPCSLEPKPLKDWCLKTTSGFEYVCSVLASLEVAILEAQGNFESSCSKGLFHGPCLTLRYIIQDLPWKDLTASPTLSATRRLVQRLVKACSKCIVIALQGVSFQSIDQQDQGEFGSFENEHAEEVILLQESKQTTTTSCFLSLKEICVFFGVLTHQVPFGASTGVRGEDVLTSQMIRKIGEMFLLIFTSTRHWGVVDGAQEGLQLLCESLLLTPKAELRALPGEWMSKMLTRVMHGELYVLRRSAGVPAFFCAILNAESASHAKCHDRPLLGAVMDALLHHLQKSYMFIEESLLDSDRSREEETIAHIFNLLRSIFLNTNIASSIQKYLEVATMKCINAFSSASWLIRNSSMLLFSAIVRRGVGVCVERKSLIPVSSFITPEGASAASNAGRPLKGVTAFQFFSRYPQLHGFLLKELNKAVDRSSCNEWKDHPGLYPILYLLSSLSPSTGDDPSAPFCMRSFQGVLRKCLYFRSAYVRRAAAAASVALIEDLGDVGKVLDQHFESGLPQKSAQEPMQAVAGLKGSSLRRAVPLSQTSFLFKQNHVHGDLLAIEAIIKATQTKMGPEHKTNIVRTLATNLPSRTWLAHSRESNPCSTTRSSMLIVLIEGYKLAREVHSLTSTDRDSVENAQVVINLCKSVWRSLQNAPVAKGSEMVGISAFRMNAARFISLVALSSFQLQELSFHETWATLEELSFRGDSESMVTGTSGLQELLNLSLPNASGYPLERLSKQNMFSRLKRIWVKCTEIVRSSQHQELLVSCLRLLSMVLVFRSEITVQEVYFPALSEKSDVRLMLQIAKHHSCIDVREHSLVLLGQLVSLWNFEKAMMQTWAGLLGEAAYAQNPPSTRIAVCISLERSALAEFEQRMSNETSADIFVSGLLMLADFLEDPSREVRLHAGKVLCDLISTFNRHQKLCTGILPTLMAVFDVLSSRYCKNKVLFQSMSDLLAAPEDSGSQVSDNLFEELQIFVGIKFDALARKHLTKDEDRISIGQRVQSHRLFAFEDDSDGEPVLRIQLFAWCYWKIFTSSLTTSNTASARTWLTHCQHVVRKLQYSVALERQQGPVAIGQASFSAKGFESLYKVVIRLFLASICLRRALSADCSQKDESSRVLSDLSILLAQSTNILHPVLTSAIAGIKDLLARENGTKEINAIQRVLFLLHIS